MVKLTPHLAFIDACLEQDHLVEALRQRLNGPPRLPGKAGEVVILLTKRGVGHGGRPGQLIADSIPVPMVRTIEDAL